jgi:Replication-relaxation
MRQLLTVQQCINGLVVQAPRALARAGRRVEVRWHWARDYVHHFSYRERETRCSADAALLLRLRPTMSGETSQILEDEWYSLFLLLDSGMGEPRLLRKRLTRLLCFRECAERWPVYHHFSPVLVLVSTGHRIEHWQRCAVEAATSLQAAPLVGAIVCLPDAGDPLAADPWRWAWKTLSTGVPCRLQNLLVPLSNKAMLPGLLGQLSAGKEQEAGKSSGQSATSASHRLSRIIRGNFMERAEHMRMEREDTNNAQDQREEMSLLALTLSRRQQEILDFLLAHPFLNAEEMAALLNVQRSSMERYLRELCLTGCITPLAVGPDRRWRLSERGLALMAAIHHQSLHSIAAPASSSKDDDEGESLVQRGIDGLYRHLEHTKGIYHFFASLSLAARQESILQGEHQLLWWETGLACERRYRDHGHWHNLRPDALAEYQVGEQSVRFWLEWDRATMGIRDLTEKFRTYAHYVASKEWFREQPVLPFLLVVTSDTGQEMRIIRVAGSVLSNTPGLVMRTTTASQLTDQGPLAAIWYSVMPKRRSGVQETRPRCPFYMLASAHSRS